ncbi:DNA-processing protein DprA [Clostridia bacterium]|nr:DNA-processing protein DprA [Clostridia bacterium]
MLYSLRDAMKLSVLYCTSEFGSTWFEQIIYKNLFAKAIDTSVQMQISLWDNPRYIVNYFDTLERLFTAKKYREEQIKKYKDKLVEVLEKSRDNRVIEERVENEMILCGEHDIQIIPLEDHNYPSKARQIESPAPTLFCKGLLPNFQGLEQSVAVIGMHEPDLELTPQMAQYVALALKEKGWWNISGLSSGCDTYAHIASLELGGKTGAVVPYGLASLVHPLENTLLADAIVERGGFLLSEMIPSMEANRISIILRDRLQSALTTALFILETDLESNTLITVDHSLKSKKTIFVFDPTGSPLENQSTVLGNELLLSLKSNDGLNSAFSYDTYRDSHIIGVTDGTVFKNWLDYMNGDSDSMIC